MVLSTSQTWRSRIRFPLGTQKYICVFFVFICRVWTSLAVGRSPVRGLLYVHKQDSVKGNALRSTGWNGQHPRSEVPQRDLRKGYRKLRGCIGPLISGILAIFPFLCQTYFVLELLFCSICILSSGLHVIRASSLTFPWTEKCVKLFLLKLHRFCRL